VNWLASIIYYVVTLQPKTNVALYGAKCKEVLDDDLSSFKLIVIYLLKMYWYYNVLVRYQISLCDLL